MRRHEGIRAAALACAVAALLSSPTFVEAKDAVRNLGGGLDQLAAPTVRTQALSRQSRAKATAQEDLSFKPAVQFDQSGRALVRIALDGKVPAATVLQSLRSTTNVEVVASDLTYRKGMIEAYVPTSSLLSVAKRKGVLAVVPSAPRVTNVGKTTSQGVVQHRVDKLPPGIDGSGITVGLLSDSFNTLGEGSAEEDVASGDLPGPGNPVNSKPVVVLQDGLDQTDTDEGRAMTQIVHDMAPKARLGFATADGGQLNFADNIRSLAGLAGAPHAVSGFKADVIVDDVIYPDEPMFQDGIIAQAVDQVVAKGVSYFSSAGNRPATQAYDSAVHIVPGKASSWAGTNLDFSDVDPALYAGGFHDFKRGGGIDIAQTIQFVPGNTLVFQWNEPFDPQPPTPVGDPLAAGTGTVPPDGDTSFTFNGTAGHIVEIFLDADTTGAGPPNPDLTFALIGPDGTEIDFVDNGTNPESLTLELPATGQYTVIVDSFQEDQFGDFQYRVQEVQVAEQVLSDYNLLFFLPDGTFIGAFAEQNRFTNRPIEIGGLPGTTLQMVIARANVPDKKNKNVADRIRYVGFGGVNPQEYFSYLDPVTYGHNSARGANGVAAYAFFPPFVPEFFTSPGPSTIYFDKNNKRFKKPEIRLKPDMAAMDGANTTFFVEDDSTDDDDFPNFFGTSAAAPHAAAIAALVLDAAGGPGKVKPDKMRKILQDSAFRHDLDPYFSQGFALTRGNALGISMQSDWSAQSTPDANVFTLSTVGRGTLQSFHINGSSANPTEIPPGIVFDPRTTPTPPPGQPFVVGSNTQGLELADITAGFSHPAPAPAEPGQWFQLDLNFAAGSFRGGDRLAFGVDRDELDEFGERGSVAGNSADLFGDAVQIPSGNIAFGGASFFGSFSNGGQFHGRFFNLIGHGYSQLDGFGFVNAEAAVNAVRKKH
jgi:hypothetical protein